MRELPVRGLRAKRPKVQEQGRVGVPAQQRANLPSPLPPCLLRPSRPSTDWMPVCMGRMILFAQPSTTDGGGSEGPWRPYFQEGDLHRDPALAAILELTGYSHLNVRPTALRTTGHNKVGDEYSVNPLGTRAYNHRGS